MNLSDYSLGDRMKECYEKIYSSQKLPYQMPIVMRLDGKAFHTLTRRHDKPFDINLIRLMDATTRYLCNQIQGVVFAYTQSDEISLLLYPWQEKFSEPWFNNNIQKMCSLASGYASAYFTTEYIKEFELDSNIIITFDCRTFVLPEHEVNNYFVWRQQDWIRNSVQMLGQSLFSHKKLHGKNCNDIKKMCVEDFGEDWELLDEYLKYGRITIKSEKWITLYDNIPLFQTDKDYIKLKMRLNLC